MATQRCPKCKGSRIRSGYKPTPLLLRMVGIYNLLCDDCNWLFRGFAIPGTVSNRTKKRKKNRPKTSKENENLNVVVLREEKDISKQNIQTVDEVTLKEDGEGALEGRAKISATESDEAATKEINEVVAKEVTKVPVIENDKAAGKEESETTSKGDNEISTKEDKKDSVNPITISKRKKKRKTNKSRASKETSPSV